ncbi:PepSY domain-containing protein [Streptomyces sp. NPDC004647]|uniref:PepSY domain-containing protein n=1 Tax=Streptomyces sp. NPDC004647 TaxID=3154671 RepID=UPI00339DD422
MKRNTVIATVTAAVLVAGGTAGAAAVADDGGAAARKASVRVAGDGPERDDVPDAGAAKTTAARTTAAQAIDAALEAAPGMVASAELDDNDDDTDGNDGNDGKDGKDAKDGTRGPVWEVDVLGADGTWHDVTVDAGNAEVLGSHTDREHDDNLRSALKNADTDAKEAAAAALKSVPGTVESVDLDDDAKAGAWEAEVRGKDGKQHDLLVDAKSGEVTASADDEDGDDDSDSDSDSDD